MQQEQQHPLRPFLPENAVLLMLGTFPPARKRWSMDFYYPNFQNDMWRIFGLVFFKDAEHFVADGKKIFDKAAITDFLARKKIALHDTAMSAVRLKDNASDAYLKICRTLDLSATFRALPDCRAVAATGMKAADTLGKICGAKIPEAGAHSVAYCAGRKFDFYRMPSSSRAYPMPLQTKALEYAKMFLELGIL